MVGKLLGYDFVFPVLLPDVIPLLGILPKVYTRMLTAAGLMVEEKEKEKPINQR